MIRTIHMQIKTQLVFTFNKRDYLISLCSNGKKHKTYLFTDRKVPITGEEKSIIMAAFWKEYNIQNSDPNWE